MKNSMLSGSVCLLLSLSVQLAAAQVPQVGDVAPEFALERLGGGSLALSELRGKVVLINFFGYS